MKLFHNHDNFYQQFLIINNYFNNTDNLFLYKATVLMLFEKCLFYFRAFYGGTINLLYLTSFVLSLCCFVAFISVDLSGPMQEFYQVAHVQYT